MTKLETIPKREHIRKVRERIKRLEALPAHEKLRSDDVLPTRREFNNWYQAYDLVMRDVHRILDQLDQPQQKGPGNHPRPSPSD